MTEVTEHVVAWEWFLGAAYDLKKLAFLEGVDVTAARCGLVEEIDDAFAKVNSSVRHGIRQFVSAGRTKPFSWSFTPSMANQLWLLPSSVERHMASRASSLISRSAIRRFSS